MWAFLLERPGAKGAPWCQCGANLPGRCAGTVLAGLSMGCGCMSTRLLSAAKVAEMLGVPTSWVYEQSRQGRIPTVALGRHRRFRREAIARWIEQLESGSRRAV
jgi:excisionase family DNA binding protein